MDKQSAFTTITIRPLRISDASIISTAFKYIGWRKPVSQYLRYFHEQEAGRRVVLVAWVGNMFVGYCTVLWKSNYPFFRRMKIPEVADLNVLPKFRRRKIGTKLMDKAEVVIQARSPFAGTGVGLAPGYNAAQRMYVKRGYIPDGLGVEYRGKRVRDGQRVVADDNLVFHLTKKLK